MSNDTLESLPPGTKPFIHQVAGHKYADRSSVGCLQSDCGLILKPIQRPPQGSRELSFYEAIFDQNCTDPVKQGLRKLIPRFHGTLNWPVNTDVRYLKLQNCTEKFSVPNIIDLKMGKISYDPEATQAKIDYELSRFPPLEKVGYRICAMKVYDPEQRRLFHFDKFYCRKLLEDTMVIEGLGKFFLFEKGLRKDVIKIVIERLREIECWFLIQKQFSFYSSSILVIWEGDMTRGLEHCDFNEVTLSIPENKYSHYKLNTETNNNSLTASGKSPHNIEEWTGKNHTQKELSSCVVDVKIIDFAHIFPASEIDENFLFGLQTLIRHLEILFKWSS